MLDWIAEHGLVFAIVFVVAVLSLTFWIAVCDQRQWDAFAAEHHCKQVAHTEGQTATTLLTDGKVGFTTFPAQTTYACDDGQQYTRND